MLISTQNSESYFVYLWQWAVFGTAAPVTSARVHNFSA